MGKLNSKIYKLFIKDYEDLKNPKVRNKYGRLTGTLGMLVNAVLCAIKITIGFASGSIAVIADGIHDLADAGAAVITLIGMKLAGKPADKKHPYGHARIEYFAGLIIAVIVVIVGIELMKTSVGKVMNPGEFTFSATTVIFLIVAICVKGSSALFIISTGKLIKSTPVIAAGTDNRNDVISSIIIVISMFIGLFTGIQLDGYMGCIVSLLILYSGYELLKSTINPLLGERPDDELVDKIEKIALSFDGVMGIHDLIVHNYGPGRQFASIHIEVDADANLMESHDMIDNVEVQIMKELGVETTCHLDPIDIHNEDVKRMYAVVEDAIKPLEGIAHMHDLRIVPGKTHTNVIFDLVMAFDCKLTEQEVKDAVMEKVRAVNSNYFVVINFDHEYTKIV